MNIDMDIFTQTAKTTWKLNKYFDNKKHVFFKEFIDFIHKRTDKNLSMKHLKQYLYLLHYRVIHMRHISVVIFQGKVSC